MEGQCRCRCKLKCTEVGLPTALPPSAYPVFPFLPLQVLSLGCAILRGCRVPQRPLTYSERIPSEENRGCYEEKTK